MKPNKYDDYDDDDDDDRETDTGSLILLQYTKDNIHCLTWNVTVQTLLWNEPYRK